MECPKCGFPQEEGRAECLRCGIIFEKYHKRQKHKKTAATASPRTGSLFQELFLFVKADVNPLVFGGRLLFFLVLLIWGLIFILKPMESNYVGESFWHLVNLPFHEAGHIIFRPLGRFMTSLGGSLGQLLMPLVCMAVFILKTRDTFAAAFALWWLAENFMDLAPYINDARAGVLPLLGGNTGQTSPYGFHDWEFILKETGLIRYDHIIAQMANAIGIVLMVASLVWGGYILFRQYQNVKRR